MFKRYIALLLVLALLCSFAPQVSAARIENRISLDRYALTTDDNVWREFTNYSTVSIAMTPGEWLVTPAFHAVDGWIASYSGFSAVSADPNVAEARIVPVAATPVSGIANSFIGLELHANNPGTTEITVSYATFVTNSAYEDRRATPHSTKTFVVTVAEHALEMDVTMSANEVVWDWPEGYRKAEETYTEVMKEANEEIAAELLSSGLTAVITSGTVLLGYGAAQAMGVAMFVPGAALAVATVAVGMAVGLAVKTQMEKAKGNSNAVKSAVDDVLKVDASDVQKAIIDEAINFADSFENVQIPVGDMIDAAEISYKMAGADLNNLLRKAAYPTAYPGQTQVLIRLTNNSSQNISAMLEISAENLSFTSEQGPWADIKTLPVVVPANGEARVPVTVFPKPGFHGMDSGIAQQMYTGLVAVQCVYHDPAAQEDVALDGAAELPIYSRLNRKDQQKAAELLLKADELRASYIMCPVDVHILDKAGNTLAVLTSGGESYVDEFVMAGTLDDMKYVMIPRDKKDDYQLKIVAVDDGTMHIIGMDGGNATNMSTYSDVQLKKGDTFFLELSEESPAALHMLNQEGTRERIDATVEINEASVAASLEKTDVSEENRAAVAHAMIHMLVPAEATTESFQTAVTLEQLAVLMINLYEQVLDMFPGDLTDMYLAEYPEAEPVSQPVAVAAWKGLLGREYETVASEKDAATRLLTAEEAQTMIDSFCEIMELPEGVTYKPESLTLEQMICMVDALWKAKMVEGVDLSLTEDLTEKLKEELIDKTYFWDYIEQSGESVYESYPVYYRENEPMQSAIRTSMIYNPLSRSATMSSGNVSSDLIRKVRMYLEYQQNGTYYGDPTNLVEFVDADILNSQGMSLRVGHLGSGEVLADDGDWSYTWVPFYFSAQYGSGIYGDDVYLAIYKGRTGADTSVSGTPEDLESRNNRMECYIISDRQIVSDFLASQYLLDMAVPAAYTVLRFGDEGEAVQELQQALASSGFFEAEPSGVYDEQTRQAVRELQTYLDLESTGVADVRLQRLLYGDMLIWDLALEDWVKPYAEQIKLDDLIG